MADIVEVMLQLNAGAYSFEAANVAPRARVARLGRRQAPGRKVLIPGVVSHATNVVEHAELVVIGSSDLPAASAART